MMKQIFSKNDIREKKKISEKFTLPKIKKNSKILKSLFHNFWNVELLGM